MSNTKLRQRIAWEAARLIFERHEAQWFRAKLMAARRVCGGEVKPYDLPTNREIRRQLQSFTRLLDGEQRADRMRAMRGDALRVMRCLESFCPQLIASTLHGDSQPAGEIGLQVFSDSVESVAAALRSEGFTVDVERRRAAAEAEPRHAPHIRVDERYPFALTVYGESLAQFEFTSLITGRPLERTTIAELEQSLAEHSPDEVAESPMPSGELNVDPFHVYRYLLQPLEHVKQSPKWHPEGDVLYHSLQVFDLARDELPYDEEFVLAALLHDVGKGLDPRNHVAAAVEALEGFVTERTLWLIEHHPEAHAVIDGTVGHRLRRRLEESEHYDDLLLLARCDRAGRQIGVLVPDIEEALEYIRELDRMYG